MTKKPLSEHLWTVNMLKYPKDCLNLHGSIFLSNVSVALKENHLKNSVLVVSETFRLLVNILTPDDKYSLSIRASV